MDSVLQDIGSAFVYLDDILIECSSEKEHIDGLSTVFRRGKEHFIGHQGSKDGSPQAQVKNIKISLNRQLWKYCKNFHSW